MRMRTHMLYVEEEEEAVYARPHTCIVSLLYYYTFLCHLMTQSGIPNSGPHSWSSLSLSPPPPLFLLSIHTHARARTHTTDSLKSRGHAERSKRLENPSSRGLPPTVAMKISFFHNKLSLYLLLLLSRSLARSRILTFTLPFIHVVC